MVLVRKKVRSVDVLVCCGGVVLWCREVNWYGCIRLMSCGGVTGELKGRSSNGEVLVVYGGELTLVGDSVMGNVIVICLIVFISGEFV